MFSRPQLKLQARQQLAGNYPAAALITLLYCAVFLVLELPGVLSGQETVPFVVTLLNWLVTGPLMLASTCCFLNLAKSGASLTVTDFFQGLCQFMTGLLGYLWMMLWTVLWTLLLIIPGIVKAYAYSQIFFILAENPAAGPRKALRLSMALTDGYKWELFITTLSFIGWFLFFGAVTVFAAIFGVAPGILAFLLCAMYLLPYFYNTMANVYLYLRDDALAQGKVQRADFGLTETVEGIDSDSARAACSEPDFIETAAQKPPAGLSSQTSLTGSQGTEPEPTGALAETITAEPQPAVSLAKAPAAEPQGPSASTTITAKEDASDDHHIQ